MDVFMLIKEPLTEKHQVPPYNKGDYKPKQDKIYLESTPKFFMEENNKVVLKIRFERVCHMMEFKSYKKNKGFPEDQEIFVF